MNLFSPTEVIDIVRNGIIKYGQGKYHVPDRMHLNRGASTNLIMPAFGEQYYCTKLISVDPQNRNTNLPVISGILVLNNSQNGAILNTMDAPMLTALRTAAVGSIGLELISKKKEINLGVIGLGVQGYWQTLFALSSQSIHEINCFSRSKNRFATFQNEIKRKHPNVLIIWCSSAEEVVRNSDVIICCTTSTRPVFKTKGLDLQLKRFISVGSFSREMQELPDEVYGEADALIIDTASAKTEVGDVINAVENDLISTSNIYALADILNGIESIEFKNNIVFKSVGMAAFDLALAISIYEKYNMK